ncbi:hypothetical protein STCU_11871 [Strigomonas culicis]|uniref:Uncharacterized protein n=1 Tax=Strigomonas culicis TaxID=28005 RepID=S9TH43_9TRYP|nr:hypothetical protein STCU_11871 [Strigomonas culicis]|eukprot:EPY15638.1 hypothetical protein STCU_11871 [Strigomonas culicis]
MSYSTVRFKVEKEGYVLPTWTHRILSVVVRVKDDDPHSALISKKHHPDILDHHRIIVHEICLWPHYHGEFIDRTIVGEGEATKLVVGLRGVFYDPNSKFPIEQQSNHTYWKLRFPDYATLKDAVDAIRGCEKNSPVLIKGSLEEVEKETHVKMESALDHLE